MKTNKLIILIFFALLLLQSKSVAQYKSVREKPVTEELNNYFQTNYNGMYRIADIIDIDSLKGDTRYFIETIQNPYGMLTNSFVFVTYFDEKNYNGVPEKNRVGIYKEGSIIWLSEPVLPNYTSYGSFFAIDDINMDGSVEIITMWGAMDVELWIISWNGMTGRLLNSEVIWGGEFATDLVDVEGDGILEIRDMRNPDGENVYSWNGYEYGQWVSTPNAPFDILFPANNFTPHVKCEVKKENNKLIYSYTVKNDETSKQRIELFWVVANVEDSNLAKSIPKQWANSVTDQNLTGWRTQVLYNGNLIWAGYSLSGFDFTTIGLPAIATFAMQADYRLPSTSEMSSEEYWALDKKNRTENMVWGTTIGPNDPPNPFIPSDFLDTLKTYTDSSHTLGWIETEQARDKYNTYFNNAKTYLAQTDSAAAKVELQLVLNECIADSSTVLTSEAFALLYFNTEYLIDQLPETNNTPMNSLSGTIQIVVTESENENIFIYNVSNSDTSSQSIENVYVSSSANDEIITAPTNWSEVTETFTYNLAGFQSETEAISSGGSQDGFTISTKGLPTIGNLYLQSQRDFIDSTDIFDNSYVVETIVPRAVPSDFEAITFIDTLLSYNTKSLDNNWLSASWVLTVLKSSLDNARLMIELDQPQSSLPIMEQFNVILASYKTSNFITDEAYYLLKPNSSYLITKLDSLINAPQNIGAFALLDTVFAAHEKNNNEGWYLYTWVYTNFTAMLNNAKITLEQNNPIGCKGVMEGFVATLDAYKASGFVTEEGHSYLKPKCLNLIEELSN